MKRYLFPTAVSVREAAISFRVSRRVIEMAIKNRELETYTPNWGIKRKLILVESLVQWVKTYWRKNDG
jgi:hypothetical protein